MLRNFRYAPSFEETHQEMSLTGRCLQPTAAWSFPTLTALRMMWGAWRESLAASRQYEQLRSSGIAHDPALREALGLGLSPARERRGTAKPLCFGGKA